MADDDQDEDELPPAELGDELDLHTFRPQEVAPLLEDYFAECRAAGIFRVRVVHGKGTGTLRETVHARLRAMPGVAGFSAADESSGGWGATWVELRTDT